MMQTPRDLSPTDRCFSPRNPAILLVGPTGSGKTPLGDMLEKVGYGGIRCCHLDFGKCLRNIADGGDGSDGFTAEDIAFVTEVLLKGVLLENERFYIAEKILNNFTRQKNMEADQFVVLNGLPRHIEQADDVDGILEVRFVLYLRCTADVVFHRIRKNTGGDREGRTDDTEEDVQRRLQLFEKRTLPVLEHYEVRGTRVNVIDVDVYTTPEQVLSSPTFFS
jgi:adenylate kinase family enzyme